MKTLSQNFIIEESHKDGDGNLTQANKNNFEASFGKLILDFISEGYTVRLSNFKTSEQDVTFEEDVVAVDGETGKESIVKEKVVKPCYNCTCLIHVIGKKEGTKNKCLNNMGSRVEIKINEKTNQIEADATGRQERVNDTTKLPPINHEGV